MNTILELVPTEIQMTELQPTTEIVETQPSDTESQRWIWAFERMKHEDLGLSFSEKVKFFCEAHSPEQIEEFIQIKLEERRIIPLAA